MFTAVFRGLLFSAFSAILNNLCASVSDCRQYTPSHVPIHPPSGWNQAVAPCWHHWHMFTLCLALCPIGVPERGSSNVDNDDGNTCLRLLPGDRSVPVAISITVRPLSSLATEQSGGVRPYGHFVEAIDFDLQWSTNHNFVNVVNVPD